jgi:hypothetical protein
MARPFALSAAISLVLACSGCSSGANTDEPNGPDNFAIAKVEAVETGSSATEDGQSLEVGCAGVVLVSYRPKVDDENRLGDFLLAPPGSCGSTVDCGWVALEAVGTDVPPINSAELPMRIDFPADKTGDGRVTFHAELRDADAQPVLVPSTQKVLAAELTVELHRRCETGKSDQ